MDLDKIDRLYTSLSTTWLIRITEEEATATEALLATMRLSLNFSLRHEVARLIVWHAFVTRPVVGAADKAARLMR